MEDTTQRTAAQSVLTALTAFADVLERYIALTEPAPVPAPTPTHTPVADLLGALAGHRGNNNVYVEKQGHFYYEIDGVNPLPRGTNLPMDELPGVPRLSGNDCPNGAVGVPRSYVLPDGWYWAQYSDGAYYITPERTEIPGPEWLHPTSVDTPTTDSVPTAPVTGNMPTPDPDEETN